MSEILKNTAWATLGNWGQQVFSFVTMIIVARLLDPAAFGMIAIALLFVFLLQRMILESVSFCIIRIEQQKLTPSFMNTAFFVSTVGAFCLSLILILSAAPLARFFGEPSLTNIIMVLSVIPLLDGLGAVQSGLMRRQMQYKALAGRTILANFLAGILGITLAFNGLGVWALVAQQIMSSLCMLLVVWIACSWKPGRQVTRVDLKELFRFCFPMLGNSMLFVIANRLDVFFLASLGGGSAAAGIYSVAKRIVRTVTDVFITGVMHVGLSQLANSQSQHSKLAGVFSKQLSIVPFIVFPLFLGIGLVAPYLVPLFLGEKWLSAVDVVRILCVYGLAQTIIQIASNLLIALGQSRQLFVYNLIGTFVVTGLLIWMAPWGPEGAALAFVLQAFITLPLLVFFVARSSKIEWPPLVVTLLKILIINGLMVAGILFCQKYWLHNNELILGLFLTSALGAVIYMAGALLLLRPILRELITRFIKKTEKKVS